MRTIAPTGWQAVDASRTVSVADNATVSGQNLRGSLTTGAVVTGSIWNDVNGNASRETGETFPSSVVVYADLDGDSVQDVGEPATSTITFNAGATQTYKLSLGQAGSYTIRERLNSPWQQVSPAAGSGHTVTVDAGGRVAAPDFVVRNPIANVYGWVYEDANGNTSREGTEAVLGGWRVYADLNDNGSPDTNEPSVTTNSSGYYSFGVDTAGSLTSVVVRAVAPASGWVSTGGGDLRTVTGLTGGVSHHAAFGYRTAGGLVSGSVWNDSNANGIRESNEGTLAARTVYADLDDDGAPGVDEPRATSFSDGNYQLLIPTAGTFNVRQVLPAGWQQTAPASAAGHSVTVTLGATGASYAAGSRITGRNFGARGTTFTVSGLVYNDADANGSRGSAEAVLGGWRVFADLNANGVFDSSEPAAITSSSGGYSLVVPSITSATSVRLRLEVQSDWIATLPLGGSGTLTASPGGAANGINFGARLVGRAIGGTIWNDADGSGIREASESALGGWTVFIDANGNGTLDSSELRTTSGSDGSYVLQVATAGDYAVRVVRASTWLATAPADGLRTVTVESSLVSGNNFGFRSTIATVSGTVFDDVNQNGGQDLGESGLAGWRIFVDLDDDGVLDAGEASTTSASNGAYTLSMVAGVSGLTTKVRVLPVTGWTAVTPAGGVHVVTVSGGQSLAGRNFGLRALGAVVRGMAWNDIDGDAVLDSGEYGYSGWTVFADVDNDSILDSNEPRTVTTSGGTYQLIIPTAGSYTIRIPTESAWVNTSPVGGGHAVTIGGTADRISGRNFGRQSAIGYVSGTVFNDADGNGAVNAGEAGLGGWRVFADHNGNGVLDNAEPSTTTSSNGFYSMSMLVSGPTLATTLRVQPQPGWIGTVPASLSRAVTVTRGQTLGAQNFGVRVDTSVAVVSGITFNDTNGNGLRDTNEYTVGGRTIYVDANDDGVMGADEARTTSGPDGTYRLAFGTAGTVLLRQVLPSGFMQTAPGGGAGLSVTVAAGDRIGDRNFGSRSAMGAISGTVFNDANATGIQDAGEAGLSGWRVYADLNGNDAWDSTEPSSLTSSSGSYYLGGLMSSSTPFEIRTVVPTGWAATVPTGGEQSVLVVAGTTVTGRNFGNRSTLSTITGTLWNDADADGIRGASESAMSGRTVFIDTDDDGVLDVNEARSYTATDGTYRLTVPTAGTYVIRQLLPTSWVQTTPVVGAGRTVVITVANETSAANDFGSRLTVATVSGSVFTDVDADGVVDSGEGVSNARVYADLDDDGTYDTNEPSFITSTSGSYSFPVSTVDPADAAALSRTISVRTLLPAGFVAGEPATGEQAVVVTGGQAATGRNFKVGVVGAGVTGVVWNDLDGNGVRDPSDSVFGSVTVFADANNNGILDLSEARTSTASDGTYRLVIPAVGTYAIRSVFSSTWISTTPSSYAITVLGGEFFSARNFGFRPPFGTVSGTVFDDVDQSGSRGTGEAGLSGWRIFADLDDDGTLDAGEPSTLTSTTGSYSLQVPTTAAPVRTVSLRAIGAAGWAALSPTNGLRAGVSVTGGGQTSGQDFGFRLTGALVTGSVWNDLNGNGVREPGDAALSGRTVYVDLDGDSTLDSNEPRATSGFDGTYQMIINEPGNYTVRQLVPTYWMPTSPTGGYLVNIDSPGSRLTGRDFGSRSTVANVSGTVFDDLDADGVRDAGESGVAGVRIYSDSNGDGAFTAGEPNVISSSSGSFFLSIPNLGNATTVRIRQDAIAGWTVTAPANGINQLQLSGGQTVSGITFGNRLTGAIVSGAVWNDLDGDGVRDAGDGGLSGRTVFVDANDNATLDAGEARAVTMSDGTYQLMVTGEGRTRIRTLLPAGWQQTLPVAGAATLDVTLGSRFTGNDFGVRLTIGAVSGTVFNDLDGSGAQGSGEAGLAGWIVYVDSNDNGVLDANELRGTTSSTGGYSISGVGEGAVKLRLQLQVGWSLTNPTDGLLLTDVVAGRTTPGRSYGVRLTPTQT